MKVAPRAPVVVLAAGCPPSLRARAAAGGARPAHCAAGRCARRKQTPLETNNNSMTVGFRESIGSTGQRKDQTRGYTLSILSAGWNDTTFE